MIKHDIASRRYGKALFEVACLLDKVDKYLEDFGDVSNILINNRELRDFLNHPRISNTEKKKVLGEIFKDKIDVEIIKLLNLLLEHNRLEEIRIIYYDYKYLVYKSRHMKIAYITTAVKMTDEEIEKIKEKLCTKYNCRVEVQNTVDPDILGGVYLRIGDKIIDATIRGTLEDMRQKLLNSSEVKP